MTGPSADRLNHPANLNYGPGAAAANAEPSRHAEPASKGVEESESPEPLRRRRTLSRRPTLEKIGARFVMHNLLFDHIEGLESSPVHFVNIGAHTGAPYRDGEGDPISAYIMRGDWKGVCFEPVEDNFKILTERMGHLKNVVLENAAVADYDGEIEIWSVDQEQTGWSFASQLSTIEPTKGYVAKARHVATSQTKPCYSLKTVVSKFIGDSFDILKIDTEGAEARILMPYITDPATLKPRIIYYEHRHLLAEERETLKGALGEQGYDVFEQPHPLDTVAIMRKQHR